MSSNSYQQMRSLRSAIMKNRQTTNKKQKLFGKNVHHLEDNVRNLIVCQQREQYCAPEKHNYTTHPIAATLMAIGLNDCAINCDAGAAPWPLLLAVWAVVLRALGAPTWSGASRRQSAWLNVSQALAAAWSRVVAVSGQPIGR